MARSIRRPQRFPRRCHVGCNVWRGALRGHPVRRGGHLTAPASLQDCIAAPDRSDAQRAINKPTKEGRQGLLLGRQAPFAPG